MTDHKNIYLMRDTVSSPIYPSLDSLDIETWLWEPNKSCIQVSTICMSVYMADCVCSEYVTHAQHGSVCVCVCLCERLSVYLSCLSDTSPKQCFNLAMVVMQPQLLWMPAPAESHPLDAGATLTVDNVCVD